MMHDIDHGDVLVRLMAKYRDRYCYLGSSSKTNSTSSNTVNPQQFAQYQANYNTAQQNGAQLAQPYSGQLTAGFTPAQVQAQGVLSGVATDPQFGNQINNAANSVKGILGNLPNGQITANPVQAGQLAGTDLSPYMNPYQNDVINSTMAQLNQQQDRALNGNSQDAIAAHAFGNDRLGVQNAITNQLFDQDNASTLAGLNQANYSNAQNAALSDIAARNNMGQFNAGQNLTAQQNTFGNQITSGNLGLNAANTANGLANSGLQMSATQAGLLSNVGQQQQAQNQAELSNAYNNWLQGKQLTLDQQQLLNQALQMIPVQQTTNSSSNTQTNPGMGGVLGALGSVALSAAMPGSGAILGGLGGGTSLLGGLFGGSGAATNPYGATSTGIYG